MWSLSIILIFFFGFLGPLWQHSGYTPGFKLGNRSQEAWWGGHMVYQIWTIIILQARQMPTYMLSIRPYSLEFALRFFICYYISSGWQVILLTNQLIYQMFNFGSILYTVVFFCKIPWKPQISWGKHRKTGLLPHSHNNGSCFAWKGSPEREHLCL